MFRSELAGGEFKSAPRGRPGSSTLCAPAHHRRVYRASVGVYTHTRQRDGIERDRLWRILNEGMRAAAELYIGGGGEPRRPVMRATLAAPVVPLPAPAAAASAAVLYYGARRGQIATASRPDKGNLREELWGCGGETRSLKCIRSDTRVHGAPGVA